MSLTEKAISQMEDWARDDSHGYDQQCRWGERGDYDCSSAVISAWKAAGIPLECTYTGNMCIDMLSKGFTDVTASVNLATGAGLKRGDVLLNERNHVAMYCGGGQEVEASINEYGGVTGGQPGDQTGTEFLIRPYRNYPWDCVLRYQEAEENVYSFDFKKIKQGGSGKDVKLLQALLRGRGYLDDFGNAIKVDGSWGPATQEAFARFQTINKLSVKTVCDKTRWKKLLWR